jgi:peptidoglycan/LPS O-acetylase OafA/YrhL
MPNPTGSLGGGATEVSTADELTGRTQARRTIGLITSFDGLRAVAVLLIVAYHARSFVPGWTRYVTGGFLGVDIFFVLSGFLVTAILLREHERTGRIRLWQFYRGRVLRLLPALLAMIAVVFVWGALTHIAFSFELPSVLEAVTGLNLWGISLPFHLASQGLFGPNLGLEQLWSLIVEEQFYVVWPLVLIAVPSIARRSRGAMVGVTVFLIAALAVHRALAETSGTVWLTMYARSDYRADSLLWGALGALLWVNGWLPRRGLAACAWVGTAVLVFCMFVARVDSRWLYLWGLPVVAVSSLFVVLALVETDWAPKRALSTRGLCAIGVVSYGLYLWHPVAFAIAQRDLASRPPAVQMASGFALAVVFTLLSWFVVERPCLRLKDRLRGRSLRIGDDGSGASAVPGPASEAAPDLALRLPTVAGPRDAGRRGTKGDST